MSRKFSNLEVTKQLITITQSHEQNYKNSIGDLQLFHGKTNQSRIFQVYGRPGVFSLCRIVNLETVRG